MEDGKKTILEDLQQQTHKLSERVKELNCLYGISNLIETPDISIAGILQGTVELLPPAWQYDSLACARLVLQDKTYKTANFQESSWRLASDIELQGEVTGILEVCYLQEPPSHDCDEPFLPEEVKLLNAVARRLGRVVERKQAELRQELAAEVLGILNDPSTMTDSISLILAAIKRNTGFDAMGIRLRSGEDFPYFVQNGFSQDFLLSENTLIARDEQGGICRDKNGKISLECTCGLVISGQTDPANPLFTEGGSFWTTNSLPLLDLSAEQDPRLHPRNKCIHQGYLSVALIPIRANREIVGLLQLNDRRSGCFTLDMIHFFERISTSIGVALMRKQVENELSEKSEFLNTLLNAIPIPVFYKDTEGLYLGFNKSFEEFYGLTHAELVGKSVFDIAPPELAAVYHEKDMELIQHQGLQVYESQVKDVHGVFHDVIFHKSTFTDHDSHVRGLIGAVLDITERKQAEEERERLISELKKALSEVKKLSGMLPICASCKKIRDDQGYWKQIEAYITDHSEAEFSHGICPDCVKKLYPELLKEPSR